MTLVRSNAHGRGVCATTVGLILVEALSVLGNATLEVAR